MAKNTHPEYIVSELSDAKWLQSLDWRKSAPVALRDAAKAGDVRQFGLGLQSAELRPAPKKRRAALATWGGLQVSSGEQLSDLLVGSAQTRIELVQRLVEQSPLSLAQLDELFLGLSLLNWSSEALLPEQVTTLWRWCLVQATALLAEIPDDFVPETLNQLRALTELQVVAGLTFTHAKSTRDWTLTGRKAWATWWEEQTDNDGPLHVRWLPEAVPLVESFARTEAFAQLHDVTILSEMVRQRFQLAAERMLSLATPGRFITLDANYPEPSPLRLAEALAALGFKKNDPIRRLLHIYAQTPDSAAVRPVNRWELPDESQQSDWTEWGVLRTSWDSDLDQVLLRHDGRLPYLDIVLNGQPMFRGDWTCELTLGDKPWEPQANWSVVCIFTDEEADFIELQQQDTQAGVTVTRQIVLNKAERLILIVEILQLAAPAQIQYRARLPFATAGVQFEFDALTREAAIKWNKQRLRVLPIAWPQDRFAPATGGISIERDGLQLELSEYASGYCLPLLLDANPARRTKPVDWCRLTVAADGQMIDASQACGRRVRIGREQWMYLHNLQKGPIPRTIMGMHTNHETVVARITREGTYEPLVQVEA